MNFWLEGDALEKFKAVLERVDVAFFNDEEARMLSGHHNLVKAAAAIRLMGVKYVVIKRGDAGAMLFSGRYHRQIGEWEMARSAYEEAVATRRELSNVPYLLEALAGLALTQSELGEQSLALQQVNEVLAELEKSSIEGAWEPFEIYWSCYLVLQRNLDFRSQLVLQQGFDLLHDWSENIQDPGQRQAFLTKVATNQKIHEAFQH